MKLLDAINDVEAHNLDVLKEIQSCLEERLAVLESQEPDCDQEFFYEKWEEKYNEFEDIKYEFDDLIDEIEDALGEYESRIEDIANNLENYQNEYGGLKRLTI